MSSSKPFLSSFHNNKYSHLFLRYSFPSSQCHRTLFYFLIQIPSRFLPHPSLPTHNFLHPSCLCFDFKGHLLFYYFLFEQEHTMIKEMVHRLREMLLFLFLAIFSKATGVKAYSRGGVIQESAAYCLSWRLAVETNNVRAWRTVPSQCLRYVEAYMLGGQYERDLNLIVDQILSYVNGIVPSSDGMDAWILDVDDTCISNVFYYRGKRYGCDPYDPAGFRAWALKGGCPAIPAILGLFEYLVQSGFKVFLVTGRDQETLGQVTIDNLHNQGFIGYERIILRTAEFIGQSAVAYKSEIRRQLEKEGYRIWGNVGDQWSDLQGECLGNRTFKLPNPMYFVP